MAGGDTLLAHNIVGFGMLHVAIGMPGYSVLIFEILFPPMSGFNTENRCIVLQEPVALNYM